MARQLDPADTTFGHVVSESISAVQLTEADQAAVLLAHRYAAAIDDALDRDEALHRFGPRLLTVLTALRATPKARGAGQPQQAPGGKLAALRQTRAA